MTLADLGLLAALHELALIDFIEANNRRDPIAAEEHYAESRRLKWQLEADAAQYAREHADELRNDSGAAAASDGGPAVVGR